MAQRDQMINQILSNFLLKDSLYYAKIWTPISSDEKLVEQIFEKIKKEKQETIVLNANKSYDMTPPT